MPQIVIADVVDDEMILDLITHATHCARSIRLPSVSRAQNASQSSEDNRLASGSLRLLYMIEAFHATRNGMPPVRRTKNDPAQWIC